MSGQCHTNDHIKDRMRVEDNRDLCNLHKVHPMHDKVGLDELMVQDLNVLWDATISYDTSANDGNKWTWRLLQYLHDVQKCANHSEVYDVGDIAAEDVEGGSNSVPKVDYGHGKCRCITNSMYDNFWSH
ncbi:uncharacterized protein BJ212DRAFT_1304700 [Suillus subaureus]|uniref:Uncharacterized protein n=1 Tax=Suillus subaureus TaxID=48587 RepID=A0A9P7DU90_9AGAM|nr:uncharacterized protein BJ212DRAFT_1304700 [Suillus subaureus]KAG1803070.1 hypothetical protein BJ212DRAFT_1304700 [Suillus subaureus]